MHTTWSASLLLLVVVVRSLHCCREDVRIDGWMDLERQLAILDVIMKGTKRSKQILD